MAWTKKTVNGMGVYTETVTLGTTGSVYTSKIDFLNLGIHANKYVTLSGYCATVSGTNVDVALYGSMNDSTYIQALDAPIADITTGTTKGATVDFKAYPYPYYKLGFLVDTDESANNVVVTITQAD